MSEISQNSKQINYTVTQQYAFSKYLAGENIFITGPGGSGKSAMIREIMKDATNRNINYQICALTGCAAILLNCGAKTIHSWGGIGLGNGLNSEIAHNVYTNKSKRKKWKNISLLIIDEVSMMSEKLIELLDMIAKKCRHNSKPFGNIQVIFSGDFYQLAPVGNRNDIKTTNFCFESPTFSEMFPKENCIQFKNIFRQTDPIYSKILNQIRVGRITKNSIKLLEIHAKRKYVSRNGIKPTILFPLKKSVRQINNQSMSELKTPIVSFNLIINICSESSTEENARQIGYLKNNVNCEQILKLRVGAQVMCIVNLMSKKNSEDKQICNGSQGIITSFNEDGFPVVKFLDGFSQVITPYEWKSESNPDISICQIPLILAWAITIHKSQGASISLAEVDVGSDIFACGQTYVALSRVTHLDGLFLMHFNYKKIKVSKKVKAFYKQLLS